MQEVCEWKFGRGGWLQVYALPERAGGGSYTLAVDDIYRGDGAMQERNIDACEALLKDYVRTQAERDEVTNMIANHGKR
jgi:hypothetical protein